MLPVENAPEVLLCLCLAGLGSRFVNAGYTTPKYLLPMGEGQAEPTILAEILGAFTGLEKARVVLVLNRRNQRWQPEVQAVIDRLPCQQPVLCQYVDDTAGQAETAAMGAALIRQECGEAAFMETPVIFHNGDTVLYQRDLSELAWELRQAAGLIDTFPGESVAYSYVTVAPGSNRVTAMAEKVVISNRASTGLYGFASAATYADFAHRTAPAGKEFYLSDVYRTMLAAEAVVVNHHVTDPAATLILGTPAEYQGYLAQQGKAA